jgi:hypothetical protein
VVVDMTNGARRTTAHLPIEVWKILEGSYGKVRRVGRVRRDEGGRHRTLKTTKAS